MKKVLLPVAAVAVLAGSYVAYPYHAVNRLSAAIRTDDQAQFEKMVDWSSVRHGLKADLIALMSGAVAQPAGHNPGRDLGHAVIEMLGPKVVDSIVETYATPGGLVGLIRDGGSIDVRAAAAKTAAALIRGMALGSAGAPASPVEAAERNTDAAADAERSVPEPAPAVMVKNTRFVGVNEMEITFENPQSPDRPAVKGVLSLEGLSWKVTRIVLPVDDMLDAPQTAERLN